MKGIPPWSPRARGSSSTGRDSHARWHPLPHGVALQYNECQAALIAFMPMGITDRQEEGYYGTPAGESRFTILDSHKQQGKDAQRHSPLLSASNRRSHSARSYPSWTSNTAQPAKRSIAHWKEEPTAPGVLLSAVFSASRRETQKKKEFPSGTGWCFGAQVTATNAGFRPSVVLVVPWTRNYLSLCNQRFCVQYQQASLLHRCHGLYGLPPKAFSAPEPPAQPRPFGISNLFRQGRFRIPKRFLTGRQRTPNFSATASLDISRS
ncbi:uncharacterized protein THITE_2130617 [Thermothielavioides terrestris NRRL 8126]|uniref:Uncharacterized protein n=1 Tax=Thermothielavioides terrestris (strain ATCC 38088 / NRRL 8126) TaxID=578455 RepID=G2RAV3_THETT|nr:uncharacterized protein THITE_2130617 [Thermothielavioides terrestris NRRL 8126]AEO68928.1 hypothetical protein THITE_2130617 [Thermothielavioides terrestris NRRL 8126]